MRATLLAAAILASPVAAPAAASDDAMGDPGRRRDIVAWMETLPGVCRENDIRWDSIQLTTSASQPHAAPTASLQLAGPERFWKLSRLMPFRVGATDLKNLGGVGLARRSEITFDVALEVPAPPATGAPAARAIEALLVRWQQGGHLRSVTMSRPRAEARTGQPLLRIPVRLAFEGDLSASLSVLRTAAAAYPHVLTQALAASPREKTTRLSVSVHVVVRAPPAGSSPPGAAGPGVVGAAGRPEAVDATALRKLVSDRILAAAPRANASINEGSGSPILLTLGGSAGSLREAGDVLVRALDLPGLSGFEALGLRAQAAPDVALAGVLEFSGRPVSP